MLFTVITINYNNSEGLENTIQSVVNQTYTDFEFIVIDGGSNDQSVKTLEAYESSITLWKSERDNGVYSAMNKGLKMAKGDYIIYMNSGDVFANTAILEEIAGKMEPSAEIIYGCHLWGDIDGDRWNPKKDFRLHEILFHTPISHQATFVKRAYLTKIGGFNEKLKIVGDWAVTIQALAQKMKFQKITLDICISELPGISSVSARTIKNERLFFLVCHFPFTFCFQYFKFFTKKIFLGLLSNKR